VETAAEMALAARRAGGRVEVVLLDGGVLPLGAGAHPRVGQVALRRLRKVGVRYVGEARLARMDGRTITYTLGEQLVTEEASLVVWSGGVKANPTVQQWRLPMDERGRIKVEQTFAVVGVPGVYAVGDIAAVQNPHTGRPDPQSAQVALRQAAHLGTSLAASLRSGVPLVPFAFPRRWQFVVAIGGRYAVGDVFGARGGGYFFFLLRHLIDLRYFLSAFSWRQAWRLYRRGTMVL
jgi:NADH dehydrogenase